jgi:N-acetylmuramic acid 6-phosphate (MurNAc-6-P) etherase
MVGVRATNAKLRRRGVRIVRDAAGVDEETAAELITAAAGDVRIALVSALTGLDVATAREHLADTGSVRVAIDAAWHAERGGRPGRGGEGEPGWDESYRVEPVGQAGL